MPEDVGQHALQPAFSVGMRCCNACSRNVYLRRTDQNIKLHSTLNCCIAVAATKADDPMPASPDQTEAAPIDVVARF